MDFDSLKDKANDLKDKALDAAGDHKDQVEGGIDKGADFLGDKVGHEDQIDQGAEKLKGFIPEN